MHERLFGWLLRLVNRNWVFLVLLASLTGAVSYSLDRANWVSDDQELIAAFTGGILLGWLLARSRYRGLFAAFYSILIAALSAIELTADIVPSTGQVLSLSADLLNELNLRAFQFYLRAGGWVETFQSGQNIEDTGLFVLLVGFLLALCGAWLMWELLRRRRALSGLLPIGLLFAINAHLSQQPLIGYAVFLLSAALLVARTAYSRQHEDWQRRGVDYPEQLGLEWGVTAVIAALIIVLLARIGPLAGTPEGWQIVSEWLKERQEQTSETAERLFSGVNSPPPAAGGASDVSVNVPNLGQVGSPIAQGYETVMWVTTSDPPPLPPEVAINTPLQSQPIHYWRGGIYSRYTGRGWEKASLAEENFPQPTGEIEPLAGRYLLRQDFQVVARHTGELFSVNDPLQTAGGPVLRATQADGSRLVVGPETTYSIISQATRVTANQLSAAQAAYPDSIAREYLQLPESLPARVQMLARRLAGSAEDPYQKVLQIQAYLRENFPYDLVVAPAPANRDVVDYFLFDQQRGFCSHYATAMAVMLRSVDVPARVVTGYAMGDYDRQRGAYRVPLSAAHAWVEVYFPGYGWVEFEPTAYRAPIEYPQESVVPSGAPPSLAEAEMPTPQSQPYRVVLVVIAVIGLLALPFWLLRMFSTARQAPALQVDGLYHRIRRALTWAGLSAVPSITPDEFLALYGARLDRYDRLQKALRQATRLYRETVYSPRPPDAMCVRIASQLWRQSLGEWLVLWLRYRWQNFRTR